jgi:hypothetical protein
MSRKTGRPRKRDNDRRRHAGNQSGIKMEKSTEIYVQNMR